METALEEMKQKKLADGMDKMLEVFLNENISEYIFYKENGKWVEALKKIIRYWLQRIIRWIGGKRL